MIIGNASGRRKLTSSVPQNHTHNTGSAQIETFATSGAAGVIAGRNSSMLLFKLPILFHRWRSILASREGAMFRSRLSVKYRIWFRRGVAERTSRSCRNCCAYQPPMFSDNRPAERALSSAEATTTNGFRYATDLYAGQFTLDVSSAVAHN